MTDPEKAFLMKVLISPAVKKALGNDVQGTFDASYKELQSSSIRFRVEEARWLYSGLIQIDQNQNWPRIPTVHWENRYQRRTLLEEAVRTFQAEDVGSIPARGKRSNSRNNRRKKISAIINVPIYFLS